MMQSTSPGAMVIFHDTFFPSNFVSLYLRFMFCNFLCFVFLLLLLATVTMILDVVVWHLLIRQYIMG